MSSDVCKHCTHAACLDVCPTGALFRTEFGTVVVQDDVCNGCGYCVAACPFGVIERRTMARRVESTRHSARSTQVPEQVRDKNVGIAQKCTLCYDRLGAGQTPRPAPRPARPSRSSSATSTSCASAPTRGSPQLHAPGVTEARLYGADPHDGVGGAGALFLLLDEPEVYGLPPDPVVTTGDLPPMWKQAGLAAARPARRRRRGFLGGRP